MTVGSLLSNVQRNDKHLEANLCTMHQSVRGTKQYWFLRKSELRCMIREWGSPTLFLTFSCSEYESPDIINYLRLMMFHLAIMQVNFVQKTQCLSLESYPCAFFQTVEKE